MKIVKKVLPFLKRWFPVFLTGVIVSMLIFAQHGANTSMMPLLITGLSGLVMALFLKAKDFSSRLRNCFVSGVVTVITYAIISYFA